ncbi:MAG: formylglycine-generating enzyme family protein [Anaerolineae bacterium]|nr:formylglycine-generating enzyme family protein [Anaerolineae bacterium]
MNRPCKLLAPAWCIWGLCLLVVLAAIILALSMGYGGRTAVEAAPNFRTTATPTPIPAGSSNADWEPIVSEINGLPMVYVPAGCFMMGSDEGEDIERPVHEVCLSEFWIGQTEVTNAQYKACVDDDGACTPPGDRTYYDDPAYADHPVVFVNWEQAGAFAAWAGGSLPTEAQWEYAARGPESWTYPWGNDEPTCERANTLGCEEEAAPVGPDERAAGASWVGALDMAGNVWEWVADWFDKDYYATLDDGVLDPIGPQSDHYRVLRGGGFNYNPDGARGASRHSYFPDRWLDIDGFRVVRDPSSLD